MGAIDVGELAEVTAAVPAAVAVVTLVDDTGAERGMTISSLAPVSVEPPSVLFCIGPRASMLAAFTPGREICINVLSSAQVRHSAGFAYAEPEPFSVFEWESAPNGAPRLVGAASWMAGVVRKVETHRGTAVVMVDLSDGGLEEGEPLMYRSRTYVSGLTPVENAGGGAW